MSQAGLRKWLRIDFCLSEHRQSYIYVKGNDQFVSTKMQPTINEDRRARIDLRRSRHKPVIARGEFRFDRSPPVRPPARALVTSRPPVRNARGKGRILSSFYHGKHDRQRGEVSR